MAISIHQSGTRDKLKPRREPYWGAPLDKGRYLGVRKLPDGTCTWIARLRDGDGRQRYKSLGQVTKAFDYGQGKEQAEEWFSDFDEGLIDNPPTVADACKEYVKDLEADGRLDSAHDARVVFERIVYKHSIGKILAKDLRTAQLKEWRDGLGGAPSSKNRHLNLLRAALNLAVRHSRVSASAAQQWKGVKPAKAQAGEKSASRRDIFLDLKERRRLLDKCEGAFNELVQAAMLTGARPGELANLKRADFDARTGTATFTGKTGSREVPLAPASAALFKRLAKNKLPDAFMLVQDDGNPWQRWDWQEPMRKAVERAKLPSGTVMYTLRHSFITEALTSGMTTLDVARLVGTSLPMIEKHYGHLVAGSARDRLARVKLL